MFQEVDPFAAELALAKEKPLEVRGTVKKAGTYRYTPGPSITFAKTGMFQFEIPNPKTGKVLKKAIQQLKFIIVEGQFYFQQWDRSSEKVKMACTTVNHFIGGKTVVSGDLMDEATQIKGTPGTWTMPYDREEVIKRYKPSGSKLNPNTGEQLTCADCMSLGLNLECQDQGSLTIYVLAWSNEEGDLVDLPEPFIATLRCPKSSAKVFYNYAVKLNAERELSPRQVVTVANIVPTFNGISNKLELHAVDPAGDLSKEAIEALSTMKKEYAEKREKEIAEWKAANQKNNPAPSGSGFGAKKPAAASSTKKSASSEEDDSDWNF
jgi:hypothetical protein